MTLQFFRRFFDIVSAIVLLSVFSIPILLTGLLIFASMGSPIIFRQDRVGLNGKIFTLYKFRTMTQPTCKGQKHDDNHSRLTSLGRLLRRTSLDELPQLFNILKGDMRLVGPRPLLVEYLTHYTKEQFRRHDVKPGITGWAQINGRNAIGWEQKFILDQWYVDNHSFLLDFKILWLTLFAVIKKKDINQEGHVGSQKFSETKLKTHTKE